MSTYTGITGKSYKTADKPFAGGGEGDIFDVVGNYKSVAKIFKADKRTTELERKLTALVKIKPSIIEQYSWPIDVLYENGKVAGYIMPKVMGSEKLRNIYVYDKRKGNPWTLYLAIAKNLSSAVYNVHKIGQVIGDLNPENILVNHQTGLVTLVDVDSFHISEPNGTFHRCGVGMPEYVSPELQGKHFPSAPLPTFTKETDLFSLAVLIFALLMNGAHPFACKTISGSSSKFQPIDNLSSGTCAYFAESSAANIDIPRYAPALDSLPKELQDLFKRTFVDGHRNPKLRPSAEMYYNALENLDHNIKVCGLNSEHLYNYHAVECPWCRVDQKMRSISQSAFSTGGMSSGSGSQVSVPVNPTVQPAGYTFKPSTVSSAPVKNNGWVISLIVGIIFMIVMITYGSNNSNNFASPTMRTIWLTDLEYIQKDDSVSIKSNEIGKTNTGDEYSHYMFSQFPYSTVSYKLSGQYNNLTAIWAQCYNNRDLTYASTFEVYADNVLIYTSPNVSGGDLPVNVDIDIKNCNVLTIMFTEGDGAAELGNILLSNTSDSKIPSFTKNDVNLPVWLTDLDSLYCDKSVSVADYDIPMYNYGDVRSNKTNTGVSFSHWIQEDRGGGNIEYYLEGKYSSISGLWAIGQYYKDDSAKNSFKIYADGKLVYTSPVIGKGDSPTSFNADIKNCQRLKIVFTRGFAGRIANIRLFPNESFAEEISPFAVPTSSTWLVDIDSLMKDGVSVNESETNKSNTGIEYSHYINGRSGSSIEWYLQGKYSNLTGVWTIDSYHKNYTNKNSFEIYADEILVYSSPTITKGDLPVPVNVDIHNCQKLKIVFTKGEKEAAFGNIALK